MNRKTTILEVYNQNKQIEKIEVLKYFTLKQDNHDYIIYRPVTADRKSFICSAQLKENEDSIFLIPIKNQKTKELIVKITEKQFSEA